MDEFIKSAQERIKEAEKSILYRAIIFIVAGLIMIIWPLKVAEFVCYGIAFVMVLFGVRFLISYVSKDLIEDFFRYDLVFGIMCLLFAVFLVAKSKEIIGFIPTIIGIIVLLNGVLKLQNAVDFARTRERGLKNDIWQRMLVMAIINIAMGAFLILEPFKSTKIVYILLGVGVLYSGISDVIVAIQFKHTMKSFVKKTDEIIKHRLPIDGKGEFVEEDDER